MYHNAFVTFTGHLENEASKNIFLKELGFSESEIEEDKSLYNIGNSYVLFENNNDFSLCIKVKLDIEEYYSKHLSVGSTLSSLQEESSQHWVAVDNVVGDKIFMLDPGSEAVDMWNQYGYINTTQFVYFKVNKHLNN